MPVPMRRIFKLLFLLTLLFCLQFQCGIKITLAQAAGPTPTKNAALPAGVEKVTIVEGFTEYRLSNGLRALLFPEPTKPTITVNVTYQVGSAVENYGETGMAHLLEHLLFKGAPKHTNIPQELTEHGARPNGSTSYDRTNYFETFQATEVNLDWALDLEADRMVNSFIAKKDLDSEMTVVRNEFEMGENSPEQVLDERILSTAYLWHSYGKSTIGARSDIENVPIERLQAFYRTYYQPDNAILLVAGKIDESKTLSLIAQKFGAIPKPARSLPKFYTTEPIQDGERTVVLRRVGDTQLVAAAYHIPAGSNPDYAAISLLTSILGDTPSGRLYKALVETKKASSVGGGSYQLHNPGIAEFNAEVREGSSLEEARDILLETVEKISGQPVTKEELERARTAALKNVDLVLNNTDRIGLALSEWIAMGDWRLFFIHRDHLKEVKLEDVQRAATTYLKSSNRTLGLFYPTKTPDRAEIPPTPDVAALVKDYKGSAAVSVGEAFDPAPANIESRTTRSSLPSGMKVALLSKKTRGATVVAQLALHFGDEASLKNLNFMADAAGQMLMRGTAKHTRQQIKDEFDRLKARVTVAGTATGANATLETQRENLPKVLRLLAEVLREPSFPESEFEPMRQEWLAQLDQQRSDPQALAVLEIQRHLRPYPKGDVRYIATLEEETAEAQGLKLESVRKFYRDFYGGSNSELSIVGDFDEPATSGLLKELFSAWKSPRPFTRVPNLFNDVPAINRSLETPDKPNAMFLAGQNMPIRDDDPDFPAMVLGNYMFGGGFLNSRLATRIRQKEGLSYGVGSQFQVSALDKSGFWMMYAILAPQNTNRLESAFQEEYARALKDGFTAEEIAAAKSGYLQSQQVNRAQDNALAAKLSNYLFLNRTLLWDAEIEKKIQSLAPDQILAAMQRHFNALKVSIVKAGDFKNSAGKSK
jgi:zinc protease